MVHVNSGSGPEELLQVSAPPPTHGKKQRREPPPGQRQVPSGDRHPFCHRDRDPVCAGTQGFPGAVGLCPEPHTSPLQPEPQQLEPPCHLDGQGGAGPS